jgi:hypothetical protein
MTVLARPRTRVHEAPPSPAGEGAGPHGGLGLLVAFVATTMVMVIAITVLALTGLWWVLVPVVLVHWVATYVVLAGIGGLLGDD